jgi:hypothetical protein
MVGSCIAWQVLFGSVAVRRGWFWPGYYTSLMVGMVRLRWRGEGFRQVRQGGLRFVCASYGKVSLKPLSRSASMRLRASRSGMRFGLLRLVSVCRVGLGRVRNHPRSGTEADRRGRGGIVRVRLSGAMPGEVSWCVLMHVLFGRGDLCNQARVGTVPDQRRRLGIVLRSIRASPG